RPIDDAPALSDQRTRAHAFRAEPARRPAREPAEVEAHAHELPDDVEACLTGLPLEALQDRGPVAHEFAPCAAEQTSARTWPERGPRGLCGPRTRDGGRHRGLVVDGELFQYVAARGVAHGEPLSVGGGGRADRHGADHSRAVRRRAILQSGPGRWLIRPWRA